MGQGTKTIRRRWQHKRSHSGYAVVVREERRRGRWNREGMPGGEDIKGQRDMEEVVGGVAAGVGVLEGPQVSPAKLVEGSKRGCWTWKQYVGAPGPGQPGLLRGRESGWYKRLAI